MGGLQRLSRDPLIPTRTRHSCGSRAGHETSYAVPTFLCPGPTEKSWEQTLSWGRKPVFLSTPHIWIPLNTNRWLSNASIERLSLSLAVIFTNSFFLINSFKTSYISNRKCVSPSVCVRLSVVLSVATVPRMALRTPLSCGFLPRTNVGNSLSHWLNVRNSHPTFLQRLFSQVLLPLLKTLQIPSPPPVYTRLLKPFNQPLQIYEMRNTGTTTSRPYTAPPTSCRSNLYFSSSQSHY